MLSFWPLVFVGDVGFPGCGVAAVYIWDQKVEVFSEHGCLHSKSQQSRSGPQRNYQEVHGAVELLRRTRLSLGISLNWKPEEATHDVGIVAFANHVLLQTRVEN